MKKAKKDPSLFEKALGEASRDFAKEMGEGHTKNEMSTSKNSIQRSKWSRFLDSIMFKKTYPIRQVRNMWSGS